MTDHDPGYKRLFSHPEMMRDLLIGFVREPWIADLDFTTLEKYPGEFTDDRLRQRRNDVIWRVRWGPDWLYLYVLLEFQSGVHPFMAARLSTYLDLLYLLIDEGAYRDAELAAMRNLAAALFRLENSRDPEPVRAVLIALAEWLNAPEQFELRHSFVVWLREAFFKTRLPATPFPELNDLEEIRIMLSERVLDWTVQWKQQGLQEGLQQGLQQGLQGERRLLVRQIRRRFGEAIALQSTPTLERIEQQAVFEELGEDLVGCADEIAWLARLQAAAKESG
jgi:hypothetical protein